MKLYNGMSPNGIRVTIFLQEKGIDLPTQQIKIMSGETRGGAYLKINSLGEIPALELDDGQILTESVAICRYLEALNPKPALMGTGPQEQAMIEMWNRRIELNIFNIIGNVGRHEFDLFKGHVEQFPDFAAAQRREFVKRLGWLDEAMSDGRAFVAGDNFTIADITGMATLMLCTFTQLGIPAELTHVKKWETSLRNRPSWPPLPG
tara:strand:- start:590 stop:1207 length:618 start_codon:yes stop_codon:yes gene_type:complete